MVALADFTFWLRWLVGWWSRLMFALMVGCLGWSWRGNIWLVLVAVAAWQGLSDRYGFFQGFDGLGSGGVKLCVHGRCCLCWWRWRPVAVICGFVVVCWMVCSWVGGCHFSKTTVKIIYFSSTQRTDQSRMSYQGLSCRLRHNTFYAR